MNEQYNSAKSHMTVEEAVGFSGLSKTCLYELMRDARLEYSKHKRFNRRLIARTELVAMLSTFLVTRRGQMLTEQGRLDLVAEGALTIDQAVDAGPFGRSKLFELLGDRELEYLTPPGADRCVPRRAL